MAGLLSQMFDGGDSYQGQQRLEAEGSLDFEQEVGVEHDLGFSVEDPNGTTHSFDSSNDLSTTVALDATLGVTVDSAEGLTAESSGF